MAKIGKDQYVIMNAVQNLTELVSELERVLGDTKIIRELVANIRLLHSTNTMKNVFNTAIAQMAAELSDGDVLDSDETDYAVTDTKPAKTNNQITYEQKRKGRQGKSV